MIAATPNGDKEISELSFWVDDPRAFVARVRPAITAVS